MGITSYFIMKKSLKNISSPFHIPAELHFQGYKEVHAYKDFEYLGYLLVNGIPFWSFGCFWELVSLFYHENETYSSKGILWAQVVHMFSAPRSLHEDGTVQTESMVLHGCVLPGTRIFLFYFFFSIRHKRNSFLDINCNSIIPCLWIQTKKKKMLCSQY